MCWPHAQTRIVGTFRHDTLPGKVAQLEVTVDTDLLKGREGVLKTELADAVSNVLPYHAVHWTITEVPGSWVRRKGHG